MRKQYENVERNNKFGKEKDPEKYKDITLMDTVNINY